MGLDRSERLSSLVSRAFAMKRSADGGGGGAGGGGKKSRLMQKTAAEFFAENKHFAGFESPGKSLYTSIRELVENSLDAAEAIGVLPEVHIMIQEIKMATFRRLHGMDASEKVDLDLYKNTETGDNPAPQKKSAGKKVSARDMTFFKLTVTDNGCGMKHEEIPKMFGSVLSGTKYGVRQVKLCQTISSSPDGAAQERGKFGLGSKMMSTGLPMQIRSSTGTSKPISVVKLDLGKQIYVFPLT
eukprot:751321-Hanusia_phi.AAC.6